MKSKTLLFSLLSVLALTGCGANSDSASQGGTPNPTSSNSSGTTYKLNEKIKRIQVVADDVGIYSVSIYLSNKIAEKGDLEFIYKGPKGSAQENSTVATLILNYWTEPTGYEIRTFYDGVAYQNSHELSEVKFLMEFGRSVRAGDVTINYTPDGGIKEQIFYASEACSYHN